MDELDERLLVLELDSELEDETLCVLDEELRLDVLELDSVLVLDELLLLT